MTVLDLTPPRRPIVPAYVTRYECALVLIGWAALVTSVVVALAT